MKAVFHAERINRRLAFFLPVCGLGATTIATLYGQPEKAAIFGCEQGASMDCESLAPARRVMFLLGNDTFTNLSPAGRLLFDAAVDWAAGIR